MASLFVKGTNLNSGCLQEGHFGVALSFPTWSGTAKSCCPSSVIILDLCTMSVRQDLQIIFWQLWHSLMSRGILLQQMQEICSLTSSMMLPGTLDSVGLKYFYFLSSTSLLN